VAKSVRIMISSAVNCGKWSVCNLPSRAVVVDVQSRLSADVVCSIAVATSLDTETTDPPAHLSITASSLNTAWIQRRQIHQRTCQSQHHHYTRPGYRDDRYTSATINHSIITAWIQRRQNHQRTCIIHILALFWKSQKMELTKQLTSLTLCESLTLFHEQEVFLAIHHISINSITNWLTYQSPVVE